MSRLMKHLDKMLVIIFALNLFDALMTMLWVSASIAEESNPIMNTVLELGPAIFLSTKLALVGLGSIILWRFRHKASAIISTIIALAAYVSVSLWHLYNLTTL